MEKRYSDILEKWFILEPPLFQVLCLHDLKAETQMACPLRSGRKRIEYNPDIVNEMSDEALEEALRAEALRILLKHPYERRPEGCSQKAMGLGSNLVIGDNYAHQRFKIETPKEYGLKGGMNYEWYARQVEEQQEGSGKGKSDEGEGPGNGKAEYGGGDNDGDEKGSGEKYRDLAELWEEDDMTAQLINGIIESTKSWGSLSGQFAEMLNASLKAKINWRNIFAGFRASIISSKRKLTRMRPNRRTGFDNMGSIRRFDTKMLVAVDVSGSISTKSLKYFYGVINSAFRYGFESIDVIQFDCGVKVVHSLKKVVKDVAVLGRGGTSFQEPIEYAHENGYDGLIILTDGYAPAPRIPEGFKTRILWVCENEDCLEQHKSWMEKSGRTCVMQIG
jgi:predicted metal-dependent peptidase